MNKVNIRNILECKSLWTTMTIANMTLLGIGSEETLFYRVGAVNTICRLGLNFKMNSFLYPVLSFLGMEDQKTLSPLSIDCHLINNPRMYLLCCSSKCIKNLWRMNWNKTINKGRKMGKICADYLLQVLYFKYLEYI